MTHPTRLWTAASFGNLLGAVVTFVAIAVGLPLTDSSVSVLGGVAGGLIYALIVSIIGLVYSAVVVAALHLINKFASPSAVAIVAIAAAVAPSLFFASGENSIESPFALLAATYGVPCVTLSIYLSFLRWGVSQRGPTAG